MAASTSGDARLRRLRAFAAWLAFALALLVAAGAATLLALERTGTLTGVLRERLAAELGLTAEELTIGSAALAWFEPGVVVEDVRLVAGDGLVRLDRLDVRLRAAADPRDPASLLRSVGVDGGRVVWSDSLARRLEDIAGARDEEAPQGRPRLPRLLVRNLELAVETPRAGTLPIGSLELVVETDDERRMRASGVLHPPGGEREPGSALHVSGLEEPDGRFRLRAGTRGLPLERLAIGGRRAGGFELGGTLRVDAEASFGLYGRGGAEARARVALADARLAPGDGLPPVEDLSADVAVRYASLQGRPYWHAPAWNVVAHATGELRGAAVEAWVLAGEAARRTAAGGVLARARLDELALDAPEIRALLRAAGAERDVAALDPAGTADLSVAARLPWRGNSLSREPDVAAHARLDGGASITFRGWPSAWDGVPEGIPLPAERLAGDFVFGGRGAPFDWTAGFRAAGDLGGGSLAGRGTLGPPARPGLPIHLDIALDAAGVRIDDTLRRALEGMRATRDVWEEYGPRAGELRTEWRLLRDAGTVGLLPEGRIGITGGAAAWADVPVPVEDVEGTLTFRWAPRGTRVTTPLGRSAEPRAFGLDYELAGHSRTADSIRLRGSSREEFAPGERVPPRNPLADAEPPPRVAHLRLEVGGLPLRGSDWDLLATRLPDVTAPVAQLQPRGKVHVVYETARAEEDAPLATAVEVEPQELVVQPTDFPMRAEDVRARVAVRAGEAPDGTPLAPVVQATLAGRWTGGATVAAAGGLPRRGRGRILVHAAGVDPSNPAVRGSLSESLAAASGERVDLSALAVEGRVDVRADLPLAREPAEPPEPDPAGDGGTIRLHLRDNALSLRTFGLSRLRGVLTLEDGVLRGERVEARLGDTAVELRDAAFLGSDVVARFDAADPLLFEPGLLPPTRVSILQADLHARDLPLDREHLAGFLDQESLDALFDQADLVGLVDLLGTRVMLVGDGAGGGKIVVRGELLPHGIAADPGLPVQVSSARIRVNRLLYEAGRLRAWADISEVYARLAGRELSGARCVAGYAEGRLTVEGLDGAFEGGRVRSLGGGERASAAMHADLAEPFRVDLAVELEDVDVDAVLEGVFPSNIRDTGRLNAQLRLAGSLADPLGLAGDGAGFITNARLWSIPVVRELFSRLGFDGTAVFDRMAFRFRLRDGVLSFPDVSARSPLLQLVGDGAVDLDGRLAFDLEVRYSLIDDLGPINRLVYWIQNNLLRVSIRGNMARPRVHLRNLLSELFGGPDLDRQDLPLPELSPLPERF